MQRRFSTVESGKGNSKKMSLQPAPVGAKCLWCSDAGWQTVRDLRISNEEDPVTDRRTMQWWRYESRRWRRTQLSSCVDVRHTTQLVHQATIPCRQRNTTTASLNSIRSCTCNQWRSRSSGAMCSYFHAEQTSRAAALIRTPAVCQAGFQVDRQAWIPDVTTPAKRPATVVLLATLTDECCAAGVAQRSSWTQSWRRGSASTRRSPRKFLGREPR